MRDALFLADFVLIQSEFLLYILEDSDFEHYIKGSIYFEVYHEVTLFYLRHEVISYFCYSLESVMDSDDDILGFIEDYQVIPA